MSGAFKYEILALSPRQACSSVTSFPLSDFDLGSPLHVGSADVVQQWSQKDLMQAIH